jgi:hypothetical protein
LAPEQRARTAFPVDHPEWPKRMNQHFYIRQGTGFKEMTEAQREAAFDLLRASLRAKGLQQSRGIMRLNHTLGELNNDNFDEYGEWLYWVQPVFLRLAGLLPREADRRCSVEGKSLSTL